MAAVPGGTDARGPVHADPHVALSSDLGLARVQSHAHLDRRSLGPGMGRQVALGVDGRSHRVVGRREADEEGIALGIDDPAVVGGESGAQELALRGQELVVSVLAKPGEQLGGALDVREEEGDRATMKLRHGPPCSQA